MSKILYPLGDNIGCIELIDSMGNDLSIVNDARASFDKTSTELNEKDIKLIKYLIKHKHTSPFRGVTFKFKVKAPLYTCRQWWKHVIASNHNDEQLGWNEKSLRYVSLEGPEYYLPKKFRKQSKDNKQSSFGVVDAHKVAVIKEAYKYNCNKAFEAYLYLLKEGVCREQARGVLPTCIYTSWVWTVSLQALLHFISLRKGEGAQQEIALYAEAIENLILPIVPITMDAWND